MSVISRVGQSFIRSAAKTGAKYLNVAPTTTQNIQGVKVITNHATGTQVAKLPDGVKNIVLGAENRLSKLFGAGTSITSYPKGHLFGTNDGMILLKGKGAKGVGMTFLPKEFGEFVKMMQELAKAKV